MNVFYPVFLRVYGAPLRFYRNNQPEPRPHIRQTTADTDAGNEESRILNRGLSYRSLLFPFGPDPEILR